MDNIVDKVFILNLDRRVDRMASMRNLMNEMYIMNWERFPAIRPNFNKIDRELYSGYKRFRKINKKYVKGSVGCKLSHLGIIKLAKERRYKNILILEDDIEFNGNMRHVDIGLRELQNLNWDILYLGLNKAKYLPTKNSIFIKKVYSGLCTHAYIVNRKSYTKIIHLLQDSDKQIDVEYQDAMISGELQCYIIPNQFSQNKSYSDINSNFF